MNRTIEKILNEFNPAHDFDRIRRANMADSKNTNEFFKEVKQQAINVVSYIKPYIRGSIVGGVIGTAASYNSGQNPAEGAFVGAALGGAVDMTQYSIRYAYRFFTGKLDAPENNDIPQQ